jgi:hypothetical protein
MNLLLFYSVVVIGPGLAGSVSAFLTFTRFRYSWVVLACSLPAVGVGVFFLVAALAVDGEFLPFHIPMLLLLILGAFSILRWSCKRPQAL